MAMRAVMKKNMVVGRESEVVIVNFRALGERAEDEDKSNKAQSLYRG